MSRGHTHDARLARARQLVEEAAGRGRSLASERVLRRRLASAGHDVSRVRLHTGADAAHIAELLGAAAVTSGSDIFFAPDRFDPGTDDGLRLIAHELAHVGQQSERGGALNRLAARGGTYRSGARDPWERMASAGRGHPPGAFAARPARPGAILQCHDSFEHRVLGDLRTEDFRALSTPARQQVLQRQLDLLWQWHQDPGSVTKEKVQALCPWIRTVTLPASGLLVTYGELNALPDYIATAATADTIPAATLLPILQVIRQEGFRSLSALLGRAVNDQFQYAPFPPSQYPIGLINRITQSVALDTLTLRLGKLGTDHYTALVGRNACHFAPFSWYRWQASYLAARDLAQRAHAASDPNVRAQLTHEAWVYGGYADHFLQDSFAAGHLVNKTLIMQWFLEWAKGKPLLVVQDWDLIKDLDTVKQPGLAGRQLYSQQWAGGSNDPQTAEDKSSYLQRRGTVGLAEANIATTYQNYLVFLSSLITQAASGAIHDHYNDVSLWVGSVAHPAAFEVYGDDTLLSGSGGADGAVITSEAAQLSQQSISELIANGTTSIATRDVRDNFPTTVRGPGDQMLGLEAWNETQKAFCAASIFPGLYDLIVGAVAPRIANISVDQDLWPRWSTSLPGSGYDITTVLPLGGRVFAASAGHVFELDPISGLVLRSIALGVSGDMRLAGDAGQLYVGVAGGVFALPLHGAWTRASWRADLAGADGNTVDVLVHAGRLYAGSNGYVYEVQLNGHSKHRVQLGSSWGSGDYTTSLSADDTMLYAGTHGYAYAVKLSGGWSGYEWDANLTDARYNHVSVLATGGRLFAGSYGYAYEFNTGSGHLIQKCRPTSWAWAPVGSYETHLATAANTLAVACHGWVYGLDLGHKWNETSAKWAVDLAGNRYQEAHVTAVGGEIYAGSYGYVWRIDPGAGQVLRRLLLTSRILFPGDYETRLGATTTDLYAGVHGYVNDVALLNVPADGPPATAWPPGQRINEVDHTPISPAAASFKQKVYVMFKADDPSDEIYATGSGDAAGWPAAAGAINPTDQTVTPVAVTVFRDKLYAIHKGQTEPQIFYSASTDGSSWPRNQRINDTDRTSAGVAAAVFNDKLYIFHKGESTNAIWYSASGDGSRWPESRTINPVDHTPLAVAAAVFNNKLHVFFRGDDPANRIYHTASGDGLGWPAAQTINDVDHTPLAVAAVVYAHALYVFFRADDASNRIYCTASTDGVKWPAAQRINDTDHTPGAPAATVFGNALCVFWRADDPPNRIYRSVMPGTA